MGKYTDERKVERYLQINIDEDTYPSSSDVEYFIQEVESYMDGLLLGTYTAVDEYIDVKPTQALSKDTIAWIEYLTSYGYTPAQGRFVIPPLLPIVSVTSLKKNESPLSSDPNWVTLTEGPGSGSDFIILKRRVRSGQILGFGLYIYNNIPEAGYQRLKGTWVYGWNLPSNILSEYATLRVAEKVLLARSLSGEPVGISEYRGPDLQDFLNTKVDVILDRVSKRIGEIEEKYFPTTRVPITSLVF